MDTVVTAPPIGASRSQDWYMNDDGAGLQEAHVRGRLVGAINQSTVSSNGDAAGTGMILTAAYIFNPVQVQGAWLRMAKVQGSIVFAPVIPLVTALPAARDIGYPQGRYIWEAFFHWPTPTPTAIVDSGLIIAPVNNARVLGTVADAGIGLGNRQGVLTFYTRGAGGFEAVDVSAFAGPLNSLNKLTLIMRQPGLNRPASVTALVNDRVAASRSYTGAHKLPLPTVAMGALACQLAHTVNTTDCWLGGLRFSSGPDVADL